MNGTQFFAKKITERGGLSVSGIFLLFACRVNPLVCRTFIRPFCAKTVSTRQFLCSTWTRYMCRCSRYARSFSFRFRGDVRTDDIVGGTSVYIDPGSDSHGVKKVFLFFGRNTRRYACTGYRRPEAVRLSWQPLPLFASPFSGCPNTGLIRQSRRSGCH